MTSTSYLPNFTPNWLVRAETWLDRRGRAAWIALMAVGFIAFWPAGLAVLGYMLWTRRLTETGFTHGAADLRSGSGNAAFDAYRAEALKRLEEEQEAFCAFVERLREARDKTEFDQFMAEHAGHADTDAIARAPAR